MKVWTINHITKTDADGHVLEWEVDGVFDSLEKAKEVAIKGDEIVAFTMNEYVRQRPAEDFEVVVK